MKNLFHLLQIDWSLYEYKFPLLAFLTAFSVTLITIPPAISLFKKWGFYDIPEARKVHTSPIPTLGGIAIIAGLIIAILIWFPFKYNPVHICFFFSIIILSIMGVMDDIRDLPARYKFVLQISLASLMAVSGVRITNLEGLFGLYQLPLYIQYTITVLAIVGITNAFNLIDGIDGLAGGIGFMSLVTLGIFHGLNHNIHLALIAFALAGGILAFLFFNFNPARIFMGDTGSLVLGFIIAILCVRLIQSNSLMENPVLPHTPVFALGIVLIPVFDTLRVFAVRIWKGKSPFTADQTHIHHWLSKAGFSHPAITRVICFLHGFILLEVFWLQGVKQELAIALLVTFMSIVFILLKYLSALNPEKKLLLTNFLKLFSKTIADKK
ncbi:MAG: undecaprenyl/decaprenyl-phosphate alpha-N-acetylglucosaminyl 1-phosphate transferase [Bacteroidetes bacterium]|nr:undecaprenyl/decaprenyl-phosphate alpha-N-acetylglucosaminyl 1-phosphate transferase [Bacteroidota bacterium]MBS1632952.1 undecaprenyl/decaprenyl-phosphate alpha-N-acetylglucosaminyl 1-phosphate transferase [Bacteroidota bacterium]